MTRSNIGGGTRLWHRCLQKQKLPETEPPVLFKTEELYDYRCLHRSSEASTLEGTEQVLVVQRAALQELIDGFENDWVAKHFAAGAPSH